MFQRKIVQQYFQRLAINAFHPLKSETFLLAYQYNLYQKFQIGRYCFSNFNEGQQEEDQNQRYKGFRRFNSQREDGKRRYENNSHEYTHRYQRNSFQRDRNRENFTKGFEQPDPVNIPPSVKKEFLNFITDQQASEEQQNEFKQKLKVQITKNGGKTQTERVILDFNEINLSTQIREALDKLNFPNPSPIQSVAIPQILSGDDIINLAQTGSGKTMAFILPSLIHLGAGKTNKFPRILVLAPTRELAMQIKSQYDLFRDTVYSTVIYGGQSKSGQQQKLLSNNDVIIATPGRLIDFIKDGFPLSTITQVILDEADRMLDMGFEPQLREILKNVRADRQTLFFSATWPQEVQDLAKDFCCQNPRLVQIGSTNLTLNKDITQQIRVINFHQKYQELMHIIQQHNNKKLLIFCQKKSDTQYLSEEINQTGTQATCLHGDLEQRERDYRMRQFKNGDAKILVATNLASRGLDVQDIEVVINFDFPECIEDYVHRIGRTGRAGKIGIAISLIEKSFNNKRIINDLIKVLKETNQEVDPSLIRLCW